MSDEEIELLDRYILTPDKEQFFSSVTHGSDTFKNLQLLYHVNRDGLKLPTESKNALERMMNDSSGSKPHACFVYELLLLENETNTAKRATLLSHFNKKYLKKTFSIPGPSVMDQSTAWLAKMELSCPSELICDRYSFEECEKSLSTHQGRYVKDIKQQYYYRLDLKKLLVVVERDLSDFQWVLDCLPSFTHVPSIGSVLLGYEAKAKKLHKSDSYYLNLTEPTYQKMTLNQMEEVQQALPRVIHDRYFVATKFRKVFERELFDLQGERNIALSDDLERYCQTLRKMYDWVRELPQTPPYRSFAAQVLRTMMELDLKRNVVDEGLFREYLSKPLRLDRAVYGAREAAGGASEVPLKDQKDPGEDVFWFDVHHLHFRRWKAERDFLTRALTVLFTRGVEYGPFAAFVDPTFLQTHYYKTQLLAGRPVQNAAGLLGEAALAALREEKHLRFAAWNKQRFHPDEPINLHLEVKNIGIVSVNIFEIDAENYYRKNLKEISEYIDLTGLIPNKSFDRVLTADPLRLQTILFENLFVATRGVYVVDFVGDGLSSRALIRVGALTVVRQLLSKGVLLHIVDEQKNICRGGATAIIVDNRALKPAEILHGGILVPFGEHPVDKTMVLLHDGFAELHPLHIPGEEVVLTCSFLLNEEDIKRKGPMELVLMPKVTVNGEKVGLVSLKNVNLTITSTSTSGVNSRTTYEEVTVDKNGKGVVLEYCVKSKTESLTMELKAKFFSTSKGKHIDLSCEERVGVNRFIGQNLFHDLYLSPCGEKDLKVHLLGKNGEPCAHKRLKIDLQSMYLTEKVQPSEILETNDAGEVLLTNAIPHIGGLRAETLDAPYGVGRTMECRLTNVDRLTSLRRAYHILKKDQLSFPAASLPFIVSDYELVKVSREDTSCVIADCSARLTYAAGMVALGDLAEGVYRFSYRTDGLSILITVHAGKRWAASTRDFVEEEKRLVKLSDPGPCLSYADVKLQDGVVDFQVVSSDLNSVEVHALAFVYFPRSLPVMREALARLRAHEGSDVYELRDHTCVYMSDKKLSDEFKYVLERKRKRHIVCSTLEKPPGLLHRHFVRETHEVDEVLRGEEDYTEVSKTRNAAPYAARKTLGGPANGPLGAEPPAPGEAGRLPAGPYAVDYLSGFLPAAGWARFDIAPDGEGRVRFAVPPDQGYSTLVIVVKDQKSGFIDWRPLPPGQAPAFRDKRLAKSKENGVAYVQARRAYCLAKGGAVEIGDSDATDFNVIDSLAALFNHLRLINPDPAMAEWEFLTKWQDLGPRAQLEKYDKYACHELNIFVYFKDPEFFHAVVRPHLRSKSQKHLIDYFLLGDVEALARFLSPTRLDLLNVLERVLLVRFFAKERGAECGAIAADVVHRVASQEPDQKLYERLFDMVVMGGVTIEEEAAKKRDSAPSNESTVNLNGAKTEVSHRNSCNSLLTRNKLLALKRHSSRSFSVNSETGGAVVAPDAYEEAVDRLEAELGPRIMKYRNVGTTNEYVEKQYLGGDLFDAAPNAFWADVLRHFIDPAAGGGFLSENFIYAARSPTEMLLVLALIDVPFAKSGHQPNSTSQKQTLTVACNAMVFTKAIQKKTNVESGFDLLMTQKFCDPNDLYTFASDGMKTLKNVEEFIVGKLYESKVVLTNASELSLPLCVVHEVPQGAIPVASSDYTQYLNLHLEPLSTQILKFLFYFPKTGEFTCYPATANRNGHLISKASIRDFFKVFRSQTVVKKDTISNVISNGSKADILSFMENHNLHQADRFQFRAIYWLLNNKQFYTDVIALLRRKLVFDDMVWSFSIKHGDFETFAEYLQLYLTKYDFGLAVTDAIQGPLYYISTKALLVDRCEYLEYYPLLVSRVHEVGKFRFNIRNRELKQCYRRFLWYLAQKSPHFTSKDYIYLCTYLLFQERLEDCLLVYPMIAKARAGTPGKKDDEELQLQFDYLTAYLDQYIDYPQFQRARDICVKYLTYPVFTWRNRFIKLFNLISEVDGDAANLPTQGDLNADGELNRIQANVDPYLAAALHLDDNSIKLTLRRIKEFTVSFYKVDMEILFSRDPFLSMSNMDYSYVQANVVHTQPMPEPLQAMATQSVLIPQDLRGSNLIIRVRSDSQVVNLTYFPKAMAVMVNRNHGLVRVLAEGNYKPLSGVYVKAFAKNHNNQVFFYKDGYTDLRGCFEYASVHTNKLDELKEFSLLILSAEFGGQIEHVGPPSTLASMDFDTTKIVSGSMQALYRKKVQDASSKYCI
ncbi:unnamed protein product [Phytomonas sp. Hart1]|nr:unnamed protein product [Phytomonas sp. Hart1]|eukprot:CCW71629.1 unnamed protein product [Phytomonas sp. isolate Hart1]